MDNTTRDRGDAMTDQLPLSVQAELAEARANADRVRRLEAELRDAENERDDAIADTIATKKAQSSTEVDSFTELLGKLADVTTESDVLQAKLDGASKVIAEMAATRDRLQAEVEDANLSLGLEREHRRRAEASSSAQAFDALMRKLDAATREVAILREAQRLVPRDLAPKHPACDCAKLPRVHAYDPRSCTAAGDESMRRDG